MRFAIGSDGQTAFKRQRGKDYVGETACFGEAICYRIPLRIQTKMEPRWEADDVLLGKLHLSDEVIVGTHPRAFRQHDHSDGCRQINHGIQRGLRMFVGVPENPLGIITIGKRLSDELFLHFSSKVQNLTVLSIIYMIRIRFFGLGELNQKGFSAAQYGYRGEESWPQLTRFNS